MTKVSEAQPQVTFSLFLRHKSTANEPKLTLSGRVRGFAAVPWRRWSQARNA
jgi:hypothetical protein